MPPSQSAPKKPRRTSRATGSASARPPARSARNPEIVEADESTVMSLARQVRGWADSVLGVAGAAADVSFSVARSMLPKAGQRAALAKAGSLVRSLREAAGLSLEELGHATNLRDPSLLELVENGKVALPFEIVLRLASVLGRNDPIAFVMKMTRSSNPDIWRTLEDLGVGRLLVQAGREREFANIYRSSDDARRLSDEEFAKVLAFTHAAFDMAIAFHATGEPPAPKERHPRPS